MPKDDLSANNSPITVNKKTGLIDGGCYIASPNFDERPKQELPGLVVVHGISLPPNQFGGEGINQLFTNQLDPTEHPYYESIEHLKVSAHALIRRDGQIIQYVPFHKRAWHAGVSSFQGRERCNDFSIGIELEGTDQTCYTASQYHALANLIRALWKTYPSIQKENLVGHCDIAPGRKTDPGDYFMWSSLNRLLES
ncbi:MAG: 1,6-anhydro-N-acetylmuramyl-L-alanine amidase AmpD [Thiomicrorhabdus sp.]|nr:1,6-anhydro-N-acetylmuramyl-L-alanine amidase AmpD [Thiomicrorhabdus sp.]